MAGTRARSSSVSPLWDRARTRSPRTSIPRSPWTPSAGWRNRAGVPVAASVAASFFPTSPDFPMPGDDHAAPARLDELRPPARSGGPGGRPERARPRPRSRARAGPPSGRRRARTGRSWTAARGRPIARSSRRSRGSRPRGSIVGPSDGARSGSSWTSMNTASHAEGHRGAGQRLDVLALPSRPVPCPPGSWTEWVASKTTGHAQAPHHAEPAEVDDQVVVAEGRAALGQEHVLAARRSGASPRRSACPTAPGTGPS